jgi:hypothetical protein
VAPESARLYGIRSRDRLRPVLDHGRAAHFEVLLTVEVDAFWLPDTAGVGYRETHSKTTIIAPPGGSRRRPWNTGTTPVASASTGGLRGVLDQPPVSRSGCCRPTSSWSTCAVWPSARSRSDHSGLGPRPRAAVLGNPVAELGDRLTGLPWLATQRWGR